MEAEKWPGGERAVKTAGKEKAGTLAAVFVILAGAAVLCFPFVSNWLFIRQAGSEAEFYGNPAASGETAADETVGAWREEAGAYNRSLAQRGQRLSEPFGAGKAEEEGEAGESAHGEAACQSGELLCYVEIPSIEVPLPVYEGTGAEVLERGIGHLEGSSLPLGGADTHCVLSGHTGLNRAKLFTDLTLVEEGDIFYLKIPGETLAYEVDRIRVVEPGDVSELGIRDGEDLVTLVTCTPYGINSHRLLVRGSRVPYREKDRTRMEEKGAVMPRTAWMGEHRLALYGVCGAGVVFLTVWVLGRRKKKEKKED